MTNTAPEKKGKNWLWALLAAVVLIGLVVFLMSRGGRADLDGAAQTTGPAEQGVPGSGGGTTADMDGDGQGASVEGGAGEAGPGTGSPAPNDHDGDGVPAGQEAGAGERR